MYHGAVAQRGVLRDALDSARLVLTSYGVVAAEYAASRRGGAEQEEGRVRTERGNTRRDREGERASSLLEIEWFRVVLDEVIVCAVRLSLSLFLARSLCVYLRLPPLHPPPLSTWL